ncbi:MAG: NAD-dependent epimerase/dehydratase family protein [Lachnospiraceae bacterium]|nr:NAD-dependent epimerase/dehydratase family protein [Lachnospiraceae bacterium]
MKRAIVTGATGFIGSWLVEELTAHGVEVTTLGREDLAATQGNVNTKEPSPCYHQGGYDCFFHLAWDGVSTEHKNDEETQLKNIPMSIRALKLSHELGCGMFVAAGTVAEYAFCNDIMDVNARQSPNDIYGATKVAVHYYLEVLSRQLNQPFIWALLPSTYGERRTDSNILTYTIRSLLAGEKPGYGNLDQLWDFLYVGEVVKALRLIGEKGRAGKIYGIGSGKYEPLKNYITRVRDVIDPDAELGIGELPAMSEKTFSSCVNIYDLVKDTGFIPEADFERDIKKTIVWLREEEMRQ